MLNKEWQYHIERSRRMSSEPIHKAFRQYGVDKFNIKQIDECHENLLDTRLEHWITKYHPEYNEIVLEVVKPKPVPKPKPPRIIRPPSSYKPWGTFTEQNRGNGKHCGLKIEGRSLDTGEITQWENARVAALDVTGDPNKNANILLSARRGTKCYGYKWKLLEDKNKKKAVFGINKRTETIGPRYESIAEACRILGNGCKSTGLMKSLKNPGHYSWKGFYWYYIHS